MLEKLMRKLGFLLLFLLYNTCRTQKFFPPAGKSGSALLCSVLPPAAPALWGSMSFSPAHAAGLLPNLHSGFACWIYGCEIEDGETTGSDELES
ncbi:hypothetical protein SLEP1_g39477 [Rubroshorea leprosula]|uniref:Secreted protein n=1 Tax=Rubroshorea leprosula TaxID=152421 RepID=A0AAV5L0B5_9ROSI|nr:hypothetical protein SLEP1_g39477 [Rubroshorea leprosula]